MHLTIARLVAATNAHDLDELVACFADDYTLTSPVHPARSFSGTEQVRRNWTQIFAAIPDVRAEVVCSAVNGETVWTEWEMIGTRGDGVAHRACGVFIFGMAGDRIQWGRMYLEPVDSGGGPTMDAALRTQLEGSR